MAGPDVDDSTPDTRPRPARHVCAPIATGTGVATGTEAAAAQLGHSNEVIAAPSYVARA